MEKNVPPPPYSETDVLSNSDSRPQFTPATSHVNNLSAESSTEGVATPIFTPASSVHPNEATENATLSPSPTAEVSNRAVTGDAHVGTANHESRSYSGGFLQANSGGFRLGPIVANNQGFRIGKLFVADSNGVKIGGNQGFVASGSGVRIGGRPLGPSQGQSSNVRGRQDQPGHDLGGEKGRARSTSSSSSSSSESSRSDASIGSLPEYDDLKPQQLPVARQSLVQWLDHPEQLVTRERVQNLRQQLKVAGKSEDVSQAKDSREMRAEVKDLLKKFKDLRKIQRKQSKFERKERRVARRAARKERKHERREGKRIRKSNRRGYATQEVRGAASNATFVPTGNGSRGMSAPAGDAEHLRREANRLDTMAAAKENSAASLRTAAASLASSDDKARAINLHKASEQEEEGVQYRLEAVRLRAEALHLDGEEIEQGQQASGVVPV